MKTCGRCTESKPLADFYRCAARRDGYQGYCKICQNNLVATWRDAHSDQNHDIAMRARFNLAPGEYAKRLAAQAGGCAICGRPCSTGRRLAVDHRHADNHVRGLLCSNHNRMLGLAADSPAILRAAAAYLEETP